MVGCRHDGKGRFKIIPRFRVWVTVLPREIEQRREQAVEFDPGHSKTRVPPIT